LPTDSCQTTNRLFDGGLICGYTDDLHFESGSLFHQQNAIFQEIFPYLQVTLR